MNTGGGGGGIKWSWYSALLGAASAVATTAIVAGKPKDPTFELISIGITSFKVNLPNLVDVELILTVHVTNPNIVPIEYASSKISIFYDGGSLLGSAQLEAGAQPAKSCRIIRLPARLDGIELAHHAAKFLADVAKREMVLDAAVDIEGTAKVLWWSHRFRAHLGSHVVVDPVFLDVIDQENRSTVEMVVA